MYVYIYIYIYIYPLQLSRRRVALGVDGGRVQGLLAAVDAEEAGGLREALRAHALHAAQRRARGEPAASGPVLRDGLGQRRGQACIEV